MSVFLAVALLVPAIAAAVIVVVCKAFENGENPFQ